MLAKKRTPCRAKRNGVCFFLKLRFIFRTDTSSPRPLGNFRRRSDRNGIAREQKTALTVAAYKSENWCLKNGVLDSCPWLICPGPVCLRLGLAAYRFSSSRVSSGYSLISRRKTLSERSSSRYCFELLLEQISSVPMKPPGSRNDPIYRLKRAKFSTYPSNITRVCQPR